MKYLREEGRIVTTAGIARRDGTFFIARRSSAGTQRGRWEFPGGKCEDPESVDECLRREFQEEFELDVVPGEELGRVAFTHDGENYVLLGIEITFTGEPPQLHEHSEVGWFAEEEAFRLDLTESDRELLSQILASP